MKNAVTVREWSFDAKPEDTLDQANGPNGQGCNGGEPFDGEPFDLAFTCDCDGTKFTGANCDVEDNEADVVVIVVISVLVLGLLFTGLLFVFTKYQRYQRSMLAVDFAAQLQRMKDDGLVDEAQASKDRIPRELSRGNLLLTDRLGAGQFGEVCCGLGCAIFAQRAPRATLGDEIGTRC